MAKKKPTARQRDIERLAKDYQSSLASLEPEYQAVFNKKTEATSGFEKQSQDFQKRLEGYQKSLSEYKTNPFEEQKIQGMYRGSFQKKASSADPYEWGYVIDDKFYGFKNLPTGYVEEREGGEFALKKKAVPKFEEAPPEAPDATQFDAELEQVKAKQKTLGEGFEREIGERKAGRVAATSRRAQSRPMLSKGATL
jgi:hypothetical protein